MDCSLAGRIFRWNIRRDSVEFEFLNLKIRDR